MAVAVLQKGKVVYRQAVGFANIEENLPITPDTRFNYCSNAKQFTALAVLTLAHQGRLRLDQDIRDFLPELFPDIKAPILLVHLLSHRSGIRDVYDLWSLQGTTWWEQTFTQKDALALLARQHELNFDPGSQYLYSNSNYILLAEVVARASGQPFEGYMDSLFRQLGMPNTGFVGERKPLSGLFARPYFNFDTWITYDWIWQVNGDGNLFTTLDDQLTWERWVQQPKKAPIPASVIRKSQSLTDLTDADNYGFGLEFGQFHDRAYTFHKGATGAWKATFMRFPEEELSIVALVNTGKTTSSWVANQVAESMLGISTDKKAFATRPDSVAPVVYTEDLPGIYLGEGTFYFRLETTDTPDELLLSRQGRNDVRMVRESGHVFHQQNDPDFKLAFVREKSGDLTLKAYYWSHAPYSLTRPQVDWSELEVKNWLGEYVNKETGASFQIAADSGRVFRITFSGETTAGILARPDCLLVDGYVLQLQQDEEGKTAILLNSDRILLVKFEHKDAD